MLDGRDAAFKRVLWLIVRSEVEKNETKGGLTSSTPVKMMQGEFQTGEEGRGWEWRKRTAPKEAAWL